LNLLWFSDIALLGTGAALWLESSLIASTMAVGVLLPELFWNFGYFVRLVSGKQVTDLTAYMFDGRRSRFMRGLSLFHIVLPPLMLWLVARFGYEQHAFAAMTVLLSFVITVK